MGKTKATAKTKKTVVDSNVEAAKKTFSYLDRWSVDESIPEGTRGRFKPLIHEIAVSEGSLEITCNKTKNGDYRWTMYFDTPEGRKKMAIGASTTKLGSPWIGAPELVKVADGAVRRQY